MFKETKKSNANETNFLANTCWWIDKQGFFYYHLLFYMSMTVRGVLIPYVPLPWLWQSFHENNISSLKSGLQPTRPSDHKTNNPHKNHEGFGCCLPLQYHTSLLKVKVSTKDMLLPLIPVYMYIYSFDHNHIMYIIIWRYYTQTQTGVYIQ